MLAVLAVAVALLVSGCGSGAATPPGLAVAGPGSQTSQPPWPPEYAHLSQRLKQIGMRARQQIEKLLGHRIHLELFVKVEEDWRERGHLLDEMGLGR